MNKKSLVIYVLCLMTLFCTQANSSAKKKQFNYKHFGIIFSGPSGVGKTTIVEELAKKHPELSISVSITTRQKRKGEVNGKDYYFIDKKKFQQLLNKKKFIEYAKNYDNYYGSPKINYTNAIKQNKDVAFVLSVGGMKNAIKNKKMDFVTIFIQASPENILKRLKGRGTETKEQIDKRFKSIKYEMSFVSKYDYTVYNDNLENTIKTIEAIYLAEKWKRAE